MGIEDTNNKEASALSLLRQKIADNRIKHQEAISLPFTKKEREIHSIDFEVIPSDTLFNYERFEQLCIIVDIHYNNYLFALENNANHIESLKLLCSSVDEMVTESCKVRWN